MRSGARGIEFRAEDEPLSLLPDLLRRRVSVRYSVITAQSASRAAALRRCGRDTGSHGDRSHRRLQIGMMIARANCRAVNGRTLASWAPSRTCGASRPVEVSASPFPNYPPSLSAIRFSNPPLLSNSTCIARHKPVISVGTWPRPRGGCWRPVDVDPGHCAGTKRFRKRAARM